MTLQDQLSGFHAALRRTRIAAHDQLLRQLAAETLGELAAFVGQRIQQIVSSGFEFARRVTHQQHDVVDALVVHESVDRAQAWLVRSRSRTHPHGRANSPVLVSIGSRKTSVTPSFERPRRAQHVAFELKHWGKTHGPWHLRARQAAPQRHPRLHPQEHRSERTRVREQIKRAIAGNDADHGRAEGTREEARAVELLPAAFRTRRRAQQPRLFAPRRNHGHVSDVVGGVQLRGARYRQHGSDRTLRHRRTEATLAETAARTARSARRSA